MGTYRMLAGKGYEPKSLTGFPPLRPIHQTQLHRLRHTESRGYSDGFDKCGTGASDMCLTCHRAHASGWEYMARWNLKCQTLKHYGGQFAGIDNKTPAVVAQGRTARESRKACYDSSAEAFARYQNGCAANATIRTDTISLDTYATSSP